MARYILLGVVAFGACLHSQILPQVAPAQIVVETSPGAAVQLDGRSSERVPAGGRITLRDIQPGEHALSVLMEGKQPFRQTMTTSAGQIVRIRAPLRDLTGRLELFTEPGAAVEIDGKPQGKSDQAGRFQIDRLSAGERRLRVSASGFTARNQTVTILSDETVTATVKLEAQVRPPAPVEPFRKFIPVRGQVGFRGSGEVESVAFSGSGDSFAAADNETPSQVFVWETATGRELATNQFGAIRSLAVQAITLNPTGTWIATTHGNRYTGARSAVRIWDAGNLKVLHTISLVEDACGLASFSPDGSRLAVGTAPKEVTVLKTSDWSKAAVIKGGGCGTFSPDGKLIATGDGRVQVWNAETGALIRTMSLSEDEAISWGKPAFSGDGRWIVATTRTGVQAWELATGRKAGHFGSPAEEQRSCALSRESGFIVTTSLTDTVIWDFSSGTALQRLNIPGYAVALSPNAEWLAVGTEVKNNVGVRLFRAGGKSDQK